jgi:hypothetical protein
LIEFLSIIDTTQIVFYCQPNPPKCASLSTYG